MQSDSLTGGLLMLKGKYKMKSTSTMVISPLFSSDFSNIEDRFFHYRKNYLRTERIKKVVKEQQLLDTVCQRLIFGPKTTNSINASKRVSFDF